MFDKVFETSQGKVGFLAETIVNGKTLHLKDIDIEPVKTGVLKVLIKEVSALKDQLIAQALAADYDVVLRYLREKVFRNLIRLRLFVSSVAYR